MKAPLIVTEEDQEVTRRCLEQRNQRLRKTDAVVQEIVRSHIRQPFKTIEARYQTNYILGLSDSGKLHWRYSIYAIRCFRTLVRRDVPLQGAHMQYFLKKAHDDHPMMVSFLVCFPQLTLTSRLSAIRKSMTSAWNLITYPYSSAVCAEGYHEECSVPQATNMLYQARRLGTHAEPQPTQPHSVRETSSTNYTQLFERLQNSSQYVDCW